ncbi:cytochrome P450 [Coniophora puteana RWD-64-598 SS2]|uniref:Cytochrome P450 n=1 Tax=Coniophora puteana (strain RWD-64-598) TaxID=741705 RepID=A0A5M3N3D0_CONPW|nr:cytochrome P450 [Coniophora puteana RWD-64-598 SS2]EIW85900.1 cytochrome P450 [Coniophora puteana RWD-64-598 SS2]
MTHRTLCFPSSIGQIDDVSNSHLAAISSPDFLSNSHPSLLVGAAAATTIATYLVRKAIDDSKRLSTLPPGPPAKWFWDSPIPLHNTHLEISKLTEQYGDVFTLRSGNNITIVIGRVEPALEILETHGGITLSRPELVAAGTMLSRGQRLISQPAGDLFKRMCKAVHEPLQPKTAMSYAPLQFEAAKRYVLNMLERPDLAQHHAELYAATVTLKLTYGKSAPSSFDDPDIKRIHKVIKHFSRVVRPGEYLAQRLPWLKNVPGYAPELKEYRQYELGLFYEQVGKTKSAIEGGEDIGPSFTRYLLENPEVHGLTPDETAYLAGTLYAAGSDTTSVGMSTIVLAAAKYPDLQAKIHAEIDTIISDRVPTPDDMHTLPYLDAFTQEALRWRPIVPLGVMHKATADFAWNGYHIPEGTAILGCHWAISRDPVAFHDPEKFDPQRWLSADGQLKSQKEIRYFTYGFGRRVCPGQHVANRSMFITMALLFWAFRIAEDPAHPIDVDAYDANNVSHHRGFKVAVEPRRSIEEIKQLLGDFSI